MTILSRPAVSAAALALAAVIARADAPAVYAIRGARLVPVASPPIDSGTIVIRNGLVDSIGAGASIPPGAEVIDGAGLTVYPGLIDLGNVRAAEQPAPSQPQNLRTTAELERWKLSQIFHPERHASNALKIDGPELTQLPAAGITSVLAIPSGEIVAGQSALVNAVAPPDEPQIGNITEPRRGTIVVKTPVALHIAYPEHPRIGGEAYPQSLMGVIAFVRQEFIDGQHHAVELARYRRAKTGERPADDPALDALEPALQRSLPVAFEANEGREILRALRMADEFKLDPIITGARHANEVISDLKAHSARVIYSVDYPQRPKNLAPDADEPIRALRERADAPKVPAELAKAGVRFGFASAGLGDPKEFVKNVAKAVGAGLTSDAAIRALTLDAATIAAAADRLGSLERGKIANLIVTRGGLVDAGMKVERVFVDGRPVSIDTAAPRQDRNRRPGDADGGPEGPHDRRER